METNAEAEETIHQRHQSPSEFASIWTSSPKLGRPFAQVLETLLCHQVRLHPLHVPSQCDVRLFCVQPKASVVCFPQQMDVLRASLRAQKSFR